MLNRSVAPTFSKNFSFELPHPKILPLQKGLDLIHLSGLQQEVFRLEIIFKSGKWYEQKLGQSHFTALMLDKGTNNKTAKTISEVFDYYGSQIEISPGYDFTSISLFALKKYIREVLPIFIEVVSAPSFPSSEFDLQKEIFVQNLRISNQKNSTIAAKLIRKNIFGSTHPYGSVIEEADATVLVTEDLQEFYKSNFSPVEIYLQGNFDFPLIEWISHQFPFSKTRLLKELNFSAEPGKMSQHENRTKSIQSSIRLGKQIINRDHPDYFSVLLLNHILGGYFGSRLMKNIREDKGLTYGIHSSLHSFKNNSMFTVGADVNKENQELVLVEIKKELKQLREIPIPIEELIVAKNHLLGSLQLEVANPFSAFDKIKNIRLNQLNDNYYKILFESVQSAKPKILMDISRKYFNLDSFHEVIVG